ncbi:hypothetical protein QYE80_08265 [Pseudomonas tohonis]|nr:hypothetical protein L682_27145 [Pseudomonas alcaligenes OT 69]MDN4144969.1 hypothetical protein [Pseudomonas tohonis]
MLEALPNPSIDGAVISANVSTGFRPTCTEGKPLRMALINEEGNVVAAGEDVAWAAWRVCVEVQENFWQCKGHLVVHSSPPGRPELMDLMRNAAA